MAASSHIFPQQFFKVERRADDPAAKPLACYQEMPQIWAFQPRGP